MSLRDVRPQVPADPLVAAATLRLAWLLFSVPYIWVWTRGLSLPVRLAAAACHALLVLAVASWNDAADGDESVPVHLGLVGDGGQRASPEAAASLAPLLAGAAVVASLPLVAIAAYAPLAVGVVLAAGWLVTSLPARQKYVGVPELMGPAVALAIPGVALGQLSVAQPRPLTIVAGTGFAVATVLALHLRDRAADEAAGIPTVAQRFPESTARWMWVCAVAGAVAATAGIYRPLSLADQFAIVGAAVFVLALTLARGRVPGLTAGHALYACALLL